MERKIKLVPLVLENFFLGLGIFYIGYVMKNKIEAAVGLLSLVIVFIVLFFPTLLVDPNIISSCDRCIECMANKSCGAYVFLNTPCPAGWSTKHFLTHVGAICYGEQLHSFSELVHGYI